jgi:hypothetical protein
MGKTVDDTDSINKQRAVRKQKRRNNASSSSSSLCSTHAMPVSKKSLELGLVLSLVLGALYLYGFWNSIRALPVIEAGRIRRGSAFILTNLAAHRLAGARDPTNAMVRPTAAAGGNHRTPQVEPRRQQQAAVAGAMRAKHVDGLEPKPQPKNETPVTVGVTAARKNKEPVIPKAIWPVRFEHERETHEFETIIHPGDKTTRMQVPRFWSPPLHQNQQYTRDQAMQIGSCIEPDPVTGSFQRGDECPMDKRTIFIAIASYRDFQCRYTVESAFNRAKHPERIRVGKEKSDKGHCI